MPLTLRERERERESSSTVKRSKTCYACYSLRHPLGLSLALPLALRVFGDRWTLLAALCHWFSGLDPFGVIM